MNIEEYISSMITYNHISRMNIQEYILIMITEKYISKINIEEYISSMITEKHISRMNIEEYILIILILYVQNSIFQGHLEEYGLLGLKGTSQPSSILIANILIIQKQFVLNDAPSFQKKG